MDPAAAEKEFTPEAKARLKKLRDALASLEDFTAAGVERTLKAVAAELGIKAGPLVHPTRLACTGAAAGPSLYHLMEILGKGTVLKRLDAQLWPVF
jgi:glutamyl-tRNA synthetase